MWNFKAIRKQRYLQANAQVCEIVMWHFSGEIQIVYLTRHEHSNAVVSLLRHPHL